MKFNHSEICAVCGKGPEDFLSKRAYKLHQKSKDHAKIFLTCDQCDKSFTSKTRLNMHYSDIIDKFVTSFENVHEKFGTTYTNKIHIIQDYLNYYLKKNNQGLGYHTDQLVESMHQDTNKIFSQSNYHAKDQFSDMHGEKHKAGIHHIALANWFTRL